MSRPHGPEDPQDPPWHRLRGGARKAVETLGTGLLRHPANAGLLDRHSPQDLHRALLWTVQRLLVLFLAEDRGMLLDPDAPEQARERYLAHHSTAVLRRRAAEAGGGHGRLWRSLRTVIDGLGGHDGLPELALPALGGIFARTDADRVLEDTELDDADLCAAVRALSQIRHGRPARPRPIDFCRLDVAELGALHESLLKHRPCRQSAARRRAFVLLPAGTGRKSGGSYYTPPALVDCLLDSALDPLLDEAVKTGRTRREQERALLALTVCDPACGSGRFLVAAAGRIARRLAFVRTGDPQPPPAALRRALRETLTTCVYGVDLDPLAVELAKVALWLETGEPGRPLRSWDERIKVGNALLGATPALLAGGIPDAAFRPLEEDDRALTAALRARNRAERRNHPPLRAWTKTHADAWCAAFVWPKTPTAPPAITTATLHGDLRRLAPRTRAELEEITARYRFFHWPLEFPQIFTGEAGAGGFACVLGNPPWERVKLHEREFFAARDEQIAAAPDAAARRRLIAALPERNPALHAAFTRARRQAEGTAHFLRACGRYPLTGHGDLNTYAVFAEAGRSLLNPRGRMGLIVPTGIATDATTRRFFRDVVESGSLVSLLDFENRRRLFRDVDSRFRFTLLTLAGPDRREPAAQFAFFLHDPAQAQDPRRRFSLTPGQIALLNPNTGTCPSFRGRRDAQLVLEIYRRVPVLRGPGGDPWGLSFRRMFDMSNDAHLFWTRDRLEDPAQEGGPWRREGNCYVRGEEVMVPLYQGVMADLYQHRAADVACSDTAAKRRHRPVRLTEKEWADPARFAQPAYWVHAADLPGDLPPWLLGFSNVTSPTNERTFLACALPPVAVGNAVPLIGTARHRLRPALLACLSSLVFDYCARQKIGGTNLNYFYVEQFPVPSPQRFCEPFAADPATAFHVWAERRVLELVYTAWDMAPFARDLGDDGPPFRWDAARRRLLRAELDAAFLHLYGIGRDDAEHILASFPIVKRKDEAACGSYRTRDLVMAAYDAMAAAAATGRPYRTVLDPPPGLGPRHPAPAEDPPPCRLPLRWRRE